MITLWHYLSIAAILFGLGLVGFLTRRNLITMFLCAEMMLQGVVINFLAFAKFHANLSGQLFGVMIVSVAACEAGLAMALFIVLYRRTKTLDVSIWQESRETGLAAALDTDELPAAPIDEKDPILTTSGHRPEMNENAEVARV